MLRNVRFGIAVMVVVVTLAGFSTSARADGDPASDFLVGADVYLPFPVPSAAASAPLLAQVKSVYAAGYWIKVAVIATKSDLGSIASLMNRPAQYARFLGTELATIYAGPLLIVMPGGFGIFDAGHATTAEQRVLNQSHIPRSAGPDELTHAAREAVAALLKARALKSKDTAAPLAFPQVSLGRRGHPMKLDYQVVENTERSSVTVEVLAHAHKIARLPVPLRRVKPQTTYGVTWNVPTTLPAGPFSLCVSARDASGNQGPTSCMTIQLS
jgi:hypothetical protein